MVTITIPFSETDRKEIEAIKRGKVGVHKGVTLGALSTGLLWGDGWSVTHIATGYQLSASVHKYEAMGFAAYLHEQRADLDFTNPDNVDESTLKNLQLLGLRYRRIPRSEKKKLAKRRVTIAEPQNQS